MKYTPKKDQSARYISLLSIVAAACLCATVMLDVPYKVLYEVAAFLLCILSFELLLRYVLTVYTYSVEGRDFAVEKRTGKLSRYVCNLSLDTALALVKTPRKGEERKALENEYGRISIRYDFCQSLGRKGAYSLLFEFNGETAEVIFQPDEEMLSRLFALIRSEK